MKDKNLIAYCGLYCGACSFKLTFDTQERAHLTATPAAFDKYKTMEPDFCPGCRGMERGSCKILDCAIDHSVEHCGQCKLFPCDLITKFNNDGIPHHGSAVKNLVILKNIGEEAWLDQQKTKWTCDCGAKLSWYLEKCPKCGKDLKKNDPSAI